MLEINFVKGRKSNLKSPREFIKELNPIINNDQKRLEKLVNKQTSMIINIKNQVDKELSEHINKHDEISLQIKKLMFAKKVITTSITKERKKRTSELRKEESFVLISREVGKLSRSLADKRQDLKDLQYYAKENTLLCRPKNYKL
jgi:hypothetical protein